MWKFFLHHSIIQKFLTLKFYSRKFSDVKCSLSLVYSHTTPTNACTLLEVGNLIWIESQRGTRTLLRISASDSLL